MVQALNDDHVAFILENANRFRAELSLLEFTKQAWEVLEPSQPFKTGWAVGAIAEHLQAVTTGEIRRLLINVPPGCTKAGPVDTPVLTPSGWKAHGELRAGDLVFAPDGRMVRVEAVTHHFDTPAHEVEFDDGATVTASQAHEWVVHRDHGETPRRRVPVRVETHEIRAGARPDSIPLANPVDLPTQHGQPIHPYLLGAWLGDGDTASGTITCHVDDAYVLMRDHGAEISRQDGNVLRLRLPGLQSKLRMLSLLGNKRIPHAYALGSIEQRWELLRGLLDTDGTATKNGSIRFTQKDAALARQVQELANSLGLKCSMHARTTTCNGKTFSHHRLTISPRNGDVYFRLERKQRRVSGVARNARGTQRYVRSVTVGAPRRMNCIQVEGGMYLLGRNLVPTSNSMMTNVMWPAWEWGPCAMPQHRFISASYEQGLATRDLVRCRDLIKSEWFQQWWPLAFKSDQDEKTYYENAKTGWRKSASVRAALTGYRGDRIIIDDPHSTKGAESDAEREESLRWFSETIPTRLNVQAESAIVVIMQRLHERDISGLIIDELGDDWVHLCLPMEFEKDRRCKTVVQVPNPNTGEFAPFEDPRTEEGELLWPERFPRDSVEELKKQLRSHGGSYAEAGQLQQHPVPREGGLIKVANFGYVDAAPTGGTVVRGWDFAATAKNKNKRAAFTAGCKMSRHVDGNTVRIYIHGMARGQWSAGEVKQQLKATATADGYGVRISIPQDPGQAGVAQVSDLAQYLEGYQLFGSVETGDKVARAIPFAAQVEAGNVYLVRGPWVDAFLAEAALFPASRFKDQIDACSRAYAELLKIKAPRIGGGGRLFT